MFGNLQTDAGNAIDWLSSHTSDALEGIKDDFLDLWAYSINAMDNIADQTVEGAKKSGEAYDTSFASAGDLMKQFWDLGWEAWSKTAKGAGKAKDAMEELEDTIDWAKKSMETMEKASDKAQKAQEKYVDKQKEYFADLKKEIQDVNEELRKNAEEFDNTRNEDIWDFARWEIEEQVALEKEIKEIKEDLADEQAEEEQNLERIADIKEEILEKEKELLDIKANISALDEWGTQDLTALLDAERARAELTDAGRRGADFQEEQDAKRQAFNEEQAQLEKRRKIFEVFQNYQFKSIKELEALKAEKRLEELSVEEQQLLQQLANERIEVLQLRDDKIQAERDLSRASIDLQNRVHQIASQNLASLDSKYTALISKINQAISAQQRLNSVKASQRYKGWPVTAGTPYLVGENPDGSINDKTTELFVPWASGSVVPASQVQQALKQIHNVDNSRKAEITWPVIVNKDMDFMLLMERAFFRS